MIVLLKSVSSLRIKKNAFEPVMEVKDCEVKVIDLIVLKITKNSPRQYISGFLR